MSDPVTDPYGRSARFYDRLVEPMNAPLREIALRLHPVSVGDRVLDVGCGTGTLLKAYAATGASCWGLDLSPAMLTVASERLGDHAVLTEADATSMPYETGFFDLVAASLFLHEVDPETRVEILTEIGRVVRPYGRVIVIDYRNGPLRWKGRGYRVMSTLAERVAGRDHYGQWRAYLAAGGLPAFVPPTLEVYSEKVVAGGNLSMWMLDPVR